MLFGASAYGCPYMCSGTHAYGHLFLVQVLKVVRPRASVHMLMDMDTCFWFKYLRSSVHVRLYTLWTWTLVFGSSS